MTGLILSRKNRKHERNTLLIIVSICTTLLSSAAISGIFFCIVPVQAQQSQKQELNEKYNLRATNRALSTESAPIIYTFYSLSGDSHQSKAELKDDKVMLQIWSETWKTMGWTPKILTVDDARKHPRFEEYNKMLDDVPLDGYSGYRSGYNRLCYLRWLAMAAVGGGFMSDYDTVPLVPATTSDIKQKEKFHLYHGNYVPALLSGTEEAWERMAFTLAETGLDHTDEVLWSDMFALKEAVQHEMEEVEISDQVLEGFDALRVEEITTKNCEYYRKKRVVHFSHNAFKLIKKLKIEDRGVVMTKWWKQYIEKCGEALEKKIM